LKDLSEIVSGPPIAKYVRNQSLKEYSCLDRLGPRLPKCFALHRVWQRLRVMYWPNWKLCRRFLDGDDVDVPVGSHWDCWVLSYDDGDDDDDDDDDDCDCDGH